MSSAALGESGIGPAGPAAVDRAVSKQDAATFYVPHVLSAYASGELSFESAAVHCAGALRVVPGAKRQQMLGSAVEALLGIMPITARKDRRPRALWLCRACNDLVELIALRERLPFSKHSTESTVFDRVADILADLGIVGWDADAVTKARADWKVHLAKA